MASRHRTTVSSTRGRKRTTFYARCFCGWAGKGRTTTAKAAEDGYAHEYTAEHGAEGLLSDGLTITS